MTAAIAKNSEEFAKVDSRVDFDVKNLKACDAATSHGSMKLKRPEQTPELDVVVGHALKKLL